MPIPFPARAEAPETDMTQRPFRDLVRLNENQRATLFDRLNATSEGESMKVCAEGRNAREGTRYHYSRAALPIAIEHPGGGYVTLMVCARNLSSGGIGFIHGGFLHANSKCKILLEQNNGVRIAVDGTVVASRHIQGSLHEVSVRFNRRIEIAQFMSEEDRSRHAQLIGGRRLEVACRVLYLQPNAHDADAAVRYLSSTGIDLRIARRPGDSLDAVKKRTFDSVMVDLDLGKDDSFEVIADLRAAGHQGQLIAVGTSAQQAMFEQARAAGATDTVIKPFAANLLYHLLSSAGLGDPLQRDADESGGDESHSLREIAADLAMALEDASIGRLRTLCEEVAASHVPDEFRELTRLADDLVESIGEKGLIEETIQSVRRLIELCTSAMGPDRRA